MGLGGQNRNANRSTHAPLAACEAALAWYHMYAAAADEFHAAAVEGVVRMAQRGQTMVAWLVLALVAAPVAAGDDGGARTGAATGPTSAPASRPKLKRSQTPAAIERTREYFLRMYAKHLKTGDPLARAMAVISLAMLDDPEATARLLEVTKTDGATIVRIYAWSALHARLDRITEAQHAEWVKVWLELARKGYLRGDLRLGLIGILKMGGPTPINKTVFKNLFMQTNAKAPCDIRTLRAMSDLLVEW